MGATKGRDGQMSVEAALLLPVLLAVVALLAQPVCVLYTRAVMASAAGEVGRLALTSEGTEDDLRAFALRRLMAVPDVPMFHEGGPAAWEVEVSGPDDRGVVSVAIEGRVRPLPLFGTLVAPLGTAEGQTVLLRVETTGSLRAGWTEGDYGDWIEMWG